MDNVQILYGRFCNRGMTVNGSAVCWINHKTTPFDNLYRGLDRNPENLIRKDEKSSRKVICSGENTRSGCQHPGTRGLASRTQTKQAVFAATVSRSSHVNNKRQTQPYQSILLIANLIVGIPPWGGHSFRLDWYGGVGRYLLT